LFSVFFLPIPSVEIWIVWYRICAAHSAGDQILLVEFPDKKITILDQWYGSGMFITDPGSGFFHPGSGSAAHHIFYLKIVTKLSAT
jgi:hypothetical protein